MTTIKELIPRIFRAFQLYHLSMMKLLKVA